MNQNAQLAANRAILTSAQAKGPLSTLFAYFRLSGPGWLQSAVTLGGGSLGGALYLGMLGGTSMLWLQLVAIVIGVIMLSAIAYVTLSTGRRPYAAINEYVNPVLGVGWITATILANMIWILPQFSLCYDALDSNVVPGGLGDAATTKIITTAILAAVALTVVLLSFRPGTMSVLFDIALKLIVGMIVLCFVAVVYRLATSGALHFADILVGFIPQVRHWNATAPGIESLLADMPAETAKFWKDRVLSEQRSSMIGVTATAVGLNMTFLLPYSMLARGWDRPFRGLARFDLITGMAIPYLLVTSCIVIASAHAFHAKADTELLSNDPAVIQSSQLFDSVLPVFESRLALERGEQAVAAWQAPIEAAKQRIALAEQEAGADVAAAAAELTAAQAAKNQSLAEFVASLSDTERKLAPTLVKPNTAQLATSLAPLLGASNANLVFGVGALGMGFSTIIILMLINGYAVAEILGQYEQTWARALGAFLACATGCCWFWIWAGGSRTWLIIVASTFGGILLPIAYIAFFALMNSRRLLGEDKPTGGRMALWNIVMAIGVAGALMQAYAGTRIQMTKPGTGSFVAGGVATFLLLALVGFSAAFKRGEPE